MAMMDLLRPFQHAHPLPRPSPSDCRNTVQGQPAHFRYPVIHPLQLEPTFGVAGMELVKPLGRGAYGDVWKVTNCNNKMLAVKIVSKKDLQDECRIWSMLSVLAARISANSNYHVPIVRMHGLHSVISTELRLSNEENVNARVGIGMDLCAGGSLAHRLRYSSLDGRPRQQLTEAEAAMIAERVAEALLFCHVTGVVQLDVKPDNVLFHGDTSDTAVLADFGLAMNLKDGSCMTELYETFNGTDLRYTVETDRYGQPVGVGTRGYRAPEVEKDGIHSSAADAWSLGAMLLEALTGALPPNNSRQPELGQLRHWKDKVDGFWLVEYMCKQETANSRWFKLSGMAKNVLMGLLCPNPAYRLTIPKVLKHPWIVAQHRNNGRNLDGELLQRLIAAVMKQ